jgi:hypothetical protein
MIHDFQGGDAMTAQQTTHPVDTAAHMLNGRFKALQCLYGIATLMEQTGAVSGSSCASQDGTGQHGGERRMASPQEEKKP